MNSKRFGAICLMGFLSYVLYHYTQNPNSSMELLVQWCFGFLIVAGFLIAAAINLTTLTYSSLVAKRKHKLNFAEITDYNKKIKELQAKPQFDTYRYFMLTWQFCLAYLLSDFGFDATAILFGAMLVVTVLSEYKMRKSLQTI